jgi:hypothetical protein
MKFLTKILLTFTLISPTFADDAVIVKSSSHYSSWQSRLEADSHNVTVGTSLPSNVSSYEMLIDFRYTTAISSSDETAMETVLTNDGTVVLIGENSNFATRNNSIQALLRQWTGDNTITYHATQYIGYDGDDEQLSDTNVLSSLPGDWSYLNFAAGGVITDLGDDGEYIAKNSDGQIGVAMWRGTALTANYQGGVVIVITDVNHASGSYYTADNTEFIDSLINDLIQQNATNRSVSSSVSITSAQTTIKNAAIAATNTNLVYIEQTGAGSIIDVFQDGEDNFIVDTDWSGPAVLNGSNQILDVDQLTSDNGIALGMVGNNIEVTVAQGTSGTNGGHKAIIDIDAASNVVGLTQYDGGTLSQHFALIDVDGASNNIQVTQRDNGQKILFMDVDIISGDIDIMQKDTGSHYLELNLTGSASHDVDIMQQGTGDHAARVSLGGGYATDFNLNQQGSTDQSYELNSTCSDALGCSVSVTQGN